MYSMLYLFGFHPHNQHHIQQLRRLQNRAVHMIFSLNKFDHVMEYFKQLQWLDLNQFIQFCLACVMFHQYHESKGILLQPPIQFRNLTSHYTRTQPYFANISRCCLSQTQQFFRHTVTSQQNSLPSDIE